MTKARDLSNIISGGFDATDIPNLDTAKITSGTFADARLPATALNSNVDLTTLSASNLTSGTIPTARISALPSGVGGKILKVSYANPSNYSTTLNYNSTSLTPCASIAVTTVGLNSHFLITWSAVHGRSGNGRSQFLMSKSYSAGSNNYADGNYFFYDHYGLYIQTATNIKNTTSYSYYDSSSTLAIGATQTFYVFLGGIGSSFTDEANNQRMQVMEIAQ